MKKNVKITIVSIAVILAAVMTAGGCDHLKSHFEGHEHGAGAGLPELDQGRKWRADAPTLKGLAALSADVAAFDARTTNAADKDYEDLAERTNASVASILRGCTMTGAGHEQLHRYIALLLKDAGDLRTGPIQERRAGFNRLKEHTGDYGRYFE